MTKDSFKRDILTLIVVSIVIGSLLAGLVSLSANSYFSKTLASLVGDYGEYDIIIQSREEMKTIPPPTSKKLLMKFSQERG